MKASTLKGTRYAVTPTAIFGCKSSSFHARRASRGGARNTQREFLEEAEELSLKDED